MPSSSPDEPLNRPLLRHFAGEKVFAQGEEYFAKGRVRQLHVSGDRATAKVSGERVYKVRLWRSRGEWQFSCDCAVGREETFCKHCVAVGLAWLAGPDGQPTAAEAEDAAGGGRRQKDARREQLQRHLRALDKDRLVNLVLEATDYDDILWRRLLMETAGVVRPAGGRKQKEATADEPDLAAYKELLREAIAAQDYVDYDAMPDYVQGVEEAIYPFADLIAGGHAAAVVELAEFALIELDKAGELLDGGDGSLNPIYDDLAHYHLEACRAAQPDPERLAARLLHYELEGGLGIFNNAAKTYADVLGQRGLAAWRRRLVREWSSLPELRPGTTKGEVIDHRRFQIQTLMERLAETDADVAALAAVKQRDLSSAHDFLSLAELYRNAGRHAEALAWGERGLQAFPELPDRVGLRDLVADEYHRLGRHEEATALAWEEFARFGSLEHYRKLEFHARQGAAGDWPRWRDRAREFLREKVHAAATGGGPADHSALVEILLADDADEDAWKEANAGGCRPDLWLRLAERRERQHPTDALRVYQQRVGPTVARGGQQAYEEAVGLLRRIKGLYERLGRGAEFSAYRAEVRATHRHKRHFLKLLDAAR